MRAHWSLIVTLTGVAAGGVIAMSPGPAMADGKKVQSMVEVHKVPGNGGVTVSFTAQGSLANARSDTAGVSLEQIGCWTIDGLSLNCLAEDNDQNQVACIVDDVVPGHGSAGYVARLAAINGDSYIWFSGQIDNSKTVPSYKCTGLLVANQSVYDPKQQ